MSSKVFIGGKLYPWQKAVTDAICNKIGSDLTVCVSAHRQAGKSFTCEQILLHYALNHARTESAMVSPTLNQSRNIFREIINATYESGVIKKKNETLLEIEFINGSRIFFRSAEMGDALRGYHVNGILIIDEFSYMQDSVAQLVLPWRQVAKAPMLVVSTPRLKTGLFFKYYTLGKEGEPNFITIDWNDFDTSELLTPEQIETYRKILPSNQFRSEILGQFLDNDGMVFTNINACIGNPDTANKLYVGIDYGSGQGEDYTSISMFNENGEMVFIDYFNDLGTFAQVERLIIDLLKYEKQIASIQTENNSIGEPLTDLLKKTLKDGKHNDLANRIVKFTTTNDSKARLVAQVQVGLERKEIKLLNDSNLIGQMSAYEAAYNFKTGKVSYNGAQGIHDDNVMSMMLAYDAYKNNKSSGVYSIGFAR